MPKLFIVEGGQESVFELLGDEVTIGRGASNAIQVFDNHASKHHAVVRTAKGRPRLVDLESKNGTRVNGQFRNQRVLEHGDTISIGSAILRYDAADAPVVTVRAPAAPARVTGRPAPAAAVAVAPSVPARAGPGRRLRDRDRGDDEDGDERERPVRRRSGSGAGIGFLVGAGVLLLIVTLFMFVLNMGSSHNVKISAQAERLANAGKLEEAVALLRTGDPNDRDSYVRVKEQLVKYEGQIAGREDTQREQKAAHVFKYEILNPFIEQHKNHIPDEEFTRRVRDFLATYKGTSEAMALENSPYDPHKKVRERFLKPATPPR